MTSIPISHNVVFKVILIILATTLVGACSTNEEGTSSDGAKPTKTYKTVGDKIITQYDSPPPMTINPDKEYIATFTLAKGGKFRIRLYPKEAPITVNSFVFLARDGFYDGVTFHRVIEGFMAQSGDPTGTGSGGPGYKFRNEPSPFRNHDKPGVISMANAGGDATNGSQFFIMFVPGTQLDGYNPNGTRKDCSIPGTSCHTVFGQVIEGMEIVHGIRRRNPSTDPEPGDIIQTITIDEK